MVTGIIRAVTQPYQPPQFAPPQPPPHPQALPGYARPRRPRGSAGPLIAGLTGLLAAGLVLGGSFPAIHVVDRGDSEVVVGWWGIEGVDLVGDAASLRGLPLVLAVLLMAGGAILAFTRQVTATRLLLALGVGSLTGTVFLQVIATMHDLNASNEVELAPGESIEFITGWGLWLPMVGIVVGAVALIFAYRGPRASVELNTPRMGFPMPYPPGPMTGVQPAVPGGQPMPAAAPAVSAPGAAAAAAVAGAPAAAPSSSTLDEEQDPETTLRTKVTEEPTEAPAASAPVAPDAPTEAPEPEAAPATPETPDAPTESAETPDESAEAAGTTETAEAVETAETGDWTDEPAAPDSTPPAEPEAKPIDLPAAPPAPELADEHPPKKD